MTQYLIIDSATRLVLSGAGFRDPDGAEGPPSPAPEAQPGTVLVAWQGRLNFSAGVGVMEWPEGATEPAWRDDRMLADMRTIALDKPRADIDTVVWDAVGNLTEEYKAAEADAREYKAAGYAGTPIMAEWIRSKDTVQRI